MRTKLDKFNTLPPKPEHLHKVRTALESVAVGEPIKLSWIVELSRLTNTQVLCALDLMIRNGEVEKKKGSNIFFTIEKTK